MKDEFIPWLLAMLAVVLTVLALASCESISLVPVLKIDMVGEQLANGEV